MPTVATTTMTPAEAAEMLRRAPVTLERWRRLRIGPPFYRVNGRVLYDRDDVESWKAERKLATQDELSR